MARHFSIWIVTLPDYEHSPAFAEVALSLRAAFAALGVDAPIVSAPEMIKDYAIVLGANLIPTGRWAALPKNLILYNLEQVQLEKDALWFKPEYIDLLRRYRVWDYSTRNIELLKGLGIHATLCGIGYMPELSGITPALEDIDIAFIGTMSPRRLHVLQQLALRGKNITVGFKQYGKQRDGIVARAKLVINLHLYEAQIFEVVRVSYMLANRKCVVSETGNDQLLEAPFKDGVAFAAYEDLVDVCVRLLDNPFERAVLAQKGFNCFSAMSQVPMLQQALATLPPE